MLRYGGTKNFLQMKIDIYKIAIQNPTVLQNGVFPKIWIGKNVLDESILNPPQRTDVRDFLEFCLQYDNNISDNERNTILSAIQKYWALQR